MLSGKGSGKLLLSLAAAVAAMVVNVLMPTGLAVWLVHLVLVWWTGLWGDRRQVLLMAVVCSVCVLPGLWLSPQGLLEGWMAVANRLLVIGGIWLIAHTVLQRQAAEKLSGLLPICSSCKKIRNAEGAWEAIEVYVRNRSEADFTHGICQECMARLYPEFAASLRASKDRS